MPRVKRGPKRKNRRGKILKLAKGYYGMKSRGHRIAKQAVEKAKSTDTEKLIAAFALLEGKRASMPSKKHGNIPL